MDMDFGQLLQFDSTQIMDLQPRDGADGGLVLVFILIEHLCAPAASGLRRSGL